MTLARLRTARITQLKERPVALIEIPIRLEKVAWCPDYNGLTNVSSNGCNCSGVVPMTVHVAVSMIVKLPGTKGG